jgi:hypothetical protein
LLVVVEVLVELVELRVKVVDLADLMLVVEMVHLLPQLDIKVMMDGKAPEVVVVDLKEDILMILDILVVMVVPVSFSSHILHKYLKT